MNHLFFQRAERLLLLGLLMTSFSYTGCTNRFAVNGTFPGSSQPSSSEAPLQGIALQSPLSKSAVFSAVHVVAQAGNTTGIGNVVVTLDGKSVYQTQNSSIDQFFPVTAGSHTVTVTGYDNNKNIFGTQTVSVSQAVDTCDTIAPNPTTPTFPAQLSLTCLYSNIQSYQVAPILRTYTPHYPLWSNGESKTRWIYLPYNSQINTDNIDAWDFPVGTKLFKEFVNGSLRVETRLLVKVAAAPGPKSWVMGAYQWRADQSDADLVTEGATNVLGTGHNIPVTDANNTSTNFKCITCHQGASDFPLGFDALQLHQPWVAGTLQLVTLQGENLLTEDPTEAESLDINGSPAAQAAMGYLHGNCAHCHNTEATAYAVNVGLNFRHNSSATSMTTENAYVTGTAKGVIVPGNPSSSLVYTYLQGGIMPLIGVQIVDTYGGVAAIYNWISSIGSNP